MDKGAMVSMPGGGHPRVHCAVRCPIRIGIREKRSQKRSENLKTLEIHGNMRSVESFPLKLRPVSNT